MNSSLHPVARAAINAVITIAVILLLWQLVVSLASPFVAKGPIQVAEFLFGEDAAEHQAAMWPLLAQTLIDAAIGFGIGLLIATVFAIAFSMSKTIEASVMPLALLLRTIPLVAIAPVILLITGRASTASVAAIGTIVVLFPALAVILFGLSRASQQSLDVVAVYGGGRWTQLMKVSLPGALPSLFAAARVAVPGAVTGALLAEWLSTGQGIGGAILRFSTAAKFEELWSSVAIITFVTLVLYNLVRILEDAVLARMHMAGTEL